MPSGTPVTKGPATGKPLPVGVTVVDPSDVDTASNTLGLNLSVGDNRAQAGAVIDYLNARGGVMGRKLVPSYHTLKSSPMSPTEAQSICDEFTVDKRMTAVISTTRDDPALIRCLTKRGTAYINDYLSTIDAASLAASHDLAFSPGSLVLDRAGRAMVDGLYAQGFLAGHVVGLIHYDIKEINDVVNRIMLPRLKELGIAKVVSSASTTSDGSTYNQTNAVVAFRNANVTRVLAFADNPIFFMTAASSQKYFPAYGLDSNVSPGGFLQQNAPKDQLSNVNGVAHVVGVMPAADVDGANDPGPVSPAKTLCLQIMTKAHQNHDERLVQQYMEWYCDSFFFLKQAMEAAGASGPTDIGRGARLLGTSYRSTVTFSTDLSTRPDGASSYRDALYVPDCSCFRYKGPKHPLP